MVILIILACAVVLYLAVLVVISRMFFGRGKEFNAKDVLRDSPDLLNKVIEYESEYAKLPYENVSVKSYDGLKLAGKFFPCGKETATTVICVHGYHSSLDNDFSGAVGYYLGMGYNVLSVSQRCHGKSEGRSLTFGVKERYDCVPWCEYIVSRFGKDVKIILNGVSMGAATVTMAADRSVGLPSNVKMIIADCGYTSPWDIICDVAKKTYHVPKFPTLYVLRAVTRVVCGFDLKGASSVEAVKNTDIPVFFAHGKADDFVPYDMVTEISGACVSDHVLFSVENAGHGFSFVVDPEGYKTALEAFIGKHVR